MGKTLPGFATICLLGLSPAVGHDLTYDADVCVCIGDMDDNLIVDGGDLDIITASFGMPCVGGCAADLNHNHAVGEGDAMMLAGYDAPCRLPGDVNGDGSVDGADVAAVFSVQGRECQYDLDRDGFVDLEDLEYAGWVMDTGEDFPRLDVDGDGSLTTLDMTAVSDVIGLDCRGDVNYDDSIDCEDFFSVCDVAGIVCPASSCP